MSEIEWTPGRWDQVKPGDSVKIVYNDGVQAILGVAAHNYTPELPNISISGGGSSECIAFYSTGAKWTLFVPAPAKPALPTEPGAYRDKDGDMWLLDRSGQWGDFSLTELPPSPSGRTHAPIDYVPFTRLEPVAETAKKVLDMVRDRALDVGTDSMTIRYLVLDNIASDFGAQS